MVFENFEPDGEVWDDSVMVCVCGKVMVKGIWNRLDFVGQCGIGVNV